jgi:L-ascorbate metabolism protein UlaG (beta-lactamase superfamily)
MSPNLLKDIPTRNFLSYFSRLFYRSIKDVFSRIKKLESHELVVDAKAVQIWMVGHATTLINIFGTVILTDPVLVHALPPKRLVAPGYLASDFPPLDYIMVSHAHFDHCDKRSLRRLAGKTKTIILPRNCSDIVKGMGFKNVIELNWEKSLKINDVTITAYRPEHWGKRWPWERIDRGFNCYLIEKNGQTVFFGGDTGYGEYFKSISVKHTIDFALLPISAYNPANLRPHHMNPAEAHQAFLDLRGKHCIPIHWGSFRLALEPMSEPPKLFMELAKLSGNLEKIHLLHNGQSFSYSPEKILS